MALHLEKKAKGEESWDDEEQVKNSQKQNRKKKPQLRNIWCCLPYFDRATQLL